MIVFTMAGESRRFDDAGYGVPKYMLPIGAATCFACAVAGFRSAFGREQFLFVLRDVDGAADFVESQLQILGLEGAKIVALGSRTAGQAETAELGLRSGGANAREPVTIFNIDTFRLDPVPPAAKGDGWLEVFTGTGDNWSFVQAEPDGRVVRVTEKDPISDLCCTGLYHFASADDFHRALAQERGARSTAQRELYVAPLYNHLIARGADIRIRPIARDDVVFCGVPAEYEAVVGNPRLRRRLEHLALAR